MSKIEILKISNIPPVYLDDLHANYTVHDAARLTDRSVLQRVRAITGGGDCKVDAALLEQCPKAEIVSVFGVGYDGVDVQAAKSRGLVVTHTPDVLNDEVADLSIGLMLSIARKIPQADRYVRSGQWAKAAFPLQRKMSGAKLGIVGLGRIGNAIAKRALGFDMQISYTSRSPKADSPYTYYSDAKSLAKAVDFLVAITPGGEGTKGMINAEVLQALGPNGFFINVARGSVADQPALIHALQNNLIAGAGLDVYYDEPAIDPAFFSLENAVVTPHMASATFETRRAMADRALQNLSAHFEGKPIPSPVPECL
jgi:lactate dehydrogenase-like 2-hydroxyacid dehydrogenase